MEHREPVIWGIWVGLPWLSSSVVVVLQDGRYSESLLSCHNWKPLCSLLSARSRRAVL